MAHGWRVTRAKSRHGAALARLARRGGSLQTLNPVNVVKLARKARGAVLGPHLAIMVHAQTGPRRDSVIDAGRRRNYAEFEREINKISHGLIAIGVRSGDRVAILMPNCAEFLVMLEALPRIGATAVSIGNRLKAQEIGYILGNARPSAVVYHDSLRAELHAAVQATEAVTDDQLVVLAASDDSAPGHRYEALLAEQPGETPPRVHGANAGGIIIYTSGTTGKPKGAERSFAKTGLESVAHLCDQLQIDRNDRHLVVCPLYHSAAPAFALIVLSLGGAVVVVDHFDAEEILATIDRHRITSAFMVPTQLVRLTQLDPAIRARYDISSLCRVLSGAAPLSAETARRFQDAFGPIVWNFYGATETGLVTLAGPDDHAARPGTVGRALGGNELRIVGEDGEEVPRGEVGELYVRNSMLISGYHGDETATNQAMRDGFFSVGDLARMDEDGYVYLASRVHDMVISGGVNIYPAEIEEQLHRHPDVLEAAVIGVPDDEWGERLKAFVVRKPEASVSAEDLIGFCREGLADYKRPREVVFVDDLPRNPTGKVLKRELREMM